MLLNVMFKTPDVLDYPLKSIEDAEERERIKEICAKWIKWDELINIQIDIEAKTATVLEI